MIGQAPGLRPTCYQVCRGLMTFAVWHIQAARWLHRHCSSVCSLILKSFQTSAGVRIGPGHCKVLQVTMLHTKRAELLIASAQPVWSVP